MSTSYSDKNNNNNIVILELTPKLNETGIVDKFVFNKKSNEIELSLNHVYDRTRVYVTVNKKSWTKTIDDFLAALKHRRISEDHKIQLRIVLDNNHDAILFSNQQVGQGKEEEDDKDRRTVAQKALDIVEDRIEQLFSDQFGNPYAVIEIHGHLETLPLKSQRFRNWITKAYYDFSETVNGPDPEISEAFGFEGQDDDTAGAVAAGGHQVLGAENITNIINLLTAKAEFDSDSKTLDLRVAKDPIEPLTYYYDLTNNDWEVVKFNPEGRQILSGHDVPILFKRQLGNQRPQVYPVNPNDYLENIFDRFMGLVNVKAGDNDSNLLLKCYIVSIFIAEVIKPILAVHGTKGAAKSFLHELIRDLTDPSSIKTLALGIKGEDITLQLSHNYVCYYDNVSKISDYVSDILCRAATGAGNSKRALYTDDQEHIDNFKRCVGINGITLAATKTDLLDRCLIIEVERISEELRREDTEIWEEYRRLKPQLLGYIFDIIVKVLKYKQEHEDIKLPTLPRLAGFAKIGEIIARCMGYADNQFIEAYYRNIALQTEAVIESSTVVNAIIQFMETNAETKQKANEQQNKDDPLYEYQDPNLWSGTPTELLADLEVIAQGLSINTKAKGWPKAPNSLSRRLAEYKTDLEGIGIIVQKKRIEQNKTKRFIELRKISSEPSDRRNPENRAQNASDISDDIPDDILDDDKVSSENDTGVAAEEPKAKAEGQTDGDIIIIPDDTKGIPDDIESHPTILSSEDKVSSGEIPKNRAQKQPSRRSDDTDDILAKPREEVEEKTDPPAGQEGEQEEDKEGYWTKGHWRNDI